MHGHGNILRWPGRLIRAARPSPSFATPLASGSQVKLTAAKPTRGPKGGGTNTHSMTPGFGAEVGTGLVLKLAPTFGPEVTNCWATNLPEFVAQNWVSPISLYDFQRDLPFRRDPRFWFANS